MPSLIKLASLARLVTLPETRRLLYSSARSGRLRDAFRRARRDRIGLLRDLADPRVAPARVRQALTHPATRELVAAGSLLVPGRYLALGWAATRAARRVSGRGRRARP